MNNIQENTFQKATGKIDYWAKLFKAKTWEDKSPEVIKDVGTK